MQELANKEHENAIALQEQADRLRSLEGAAQKLQRFETRLPAIRHYLGVIPMLKE